MVGIVNMGDPEVGHAWRDEGELHCDAQYLGLLLSGKLEDKSQTYWVDTSLATEEREKFLLFVERVIIALGTGSVQASEIRATATAYYPLPDDPTASDQAGEHWLMLRTINWAKAHRFNLAFVVLPDNKDDEGVLGNVELEASDLCSNRTVNVDSKTILDFGDAYP